MFTWEFSCGNKNRNKAIFVKMLSVVEQLILGFHLRPSHQEKTLADYALTLSLSSMIGDHWYKSQLLITELQ